MEKWFFCSGIFFSFCNTAKKIGHKVQKIVSILRNNIGIIASFTNETLQSANELQASGYENVMNKKYNRLNRDVMDATMKQVRIANMSQSVGTLFNVVGLLIVIAFGSYQIMIGNMTVGTLFALTVYVQRLYAPIVSLGNAYIEIKNSIPKIRKIMGIIETPYIINSGTYVANSMIKGNIVFDNVDFSYGEKIILSKFKFKLNQGEIVGVVGKNGVGKSTLIKLILNLCIPQKGLILVDDKMVSEYDNNYFREQIGYIGQNSFLISGKLKEILDPNGNMPESKILTLIKEFQLEIERFEQGLDTVIDENHRNLSGGEFQKIALIRGFMKEKSIYLLDEPTAAMDEQSERKICEVIKLKLKNKTAIIITHRTKILEICDAVIEISNSNNI